MFGRNDSPASNDAFPALYCFALKQEARFVSKPAEAILITGMGPRNAERTLLAALSRVRPQCVFSCGFAGGLNPALAGGTVVFSAPEAGAWFEPLRAAGAEPATFHTSDRVAVTIEEKRRLRQTTGADALDMESGVIARVCLERGIPSVILRVISDSALEDLPLDFNRMMTGDHRLHYGKLCASLMRSPGKVGALLRLSRRTRAAAKALGGVLGRMESLTR